MTPQQILKNPKDQLIAVDIDGVLTDGCECWTQESCLVATPNQKVIDYVNDLYNKGAHIIIYTARKENMRQETEFWLRKHQVRKHGLTMEKQGMDLLLDDKCININDIKL
jgi:hypothetical protein